MKSAKRKCATRNPRKSKKSRMKMGRPRNPVLHSPLLQDRGEQTFSSGQVAQQLGVSNDVIRLACHTGQIRAAMTAGGHLRIPESERARLIRDGLPASPTQGNRVANPAPAQTQEEAPAIRPLRHPRLLARPSEDAVGAADEAVVTENELARLRLLREKDQEMDYFRQKAAAKEAQQEEQQRIRREREDQERRDNWYEFWLEQAAGMVPADAQEIIGDVYSDVEEALSNRDHNESASVMRPLVQGIVQGKLGVLRQKQEIEQIVRTAPQQLPWSMRSIWGHSERENAVAEKVAQEVRRLGPNVTPAEARAVVGRIVTAAERRFDHEKLCEETLRRVPTKLFSLDTATIEEAKKAVAEAVQKLPEGTPACDMEAVAMRTLGPFLQRKRAVDQAEKWVRHASHYMSTEIPQSELGPSGTFAAAQELPRLLRPKLVAGFLDGSITEQSAKGFVEDFVEASVYEQRRFSSSR